MNYHETNFSITLEKEANPVDFFGERLEIEMHKGNLLSFQKIMLP